MQRLATILTLVLALLPTWWLLGAAPLTASSDGRYAAAAEQMARTDDWLVPHLGDQAHLTKPPLTYWAEAAAIELLGANELAVRLPAAIAMIGVVLGVFALGRRLGGRTLGLAAAMLLGVMPLPVIVGRLTLTDGLLAPCWFAVLAGGWLAIREPTRRRGAALLWAAVALGWMIKGPIILIPLLPLIAWRGFAGRWTELGRLRPLVGFPLSLLPIAAWAATVALTVPEATDVWRHEVLGRAAGGGSHPEPWWYFLPVFLVGLFPATAMLPLPGLNLAPRQAWRTLRDGHDAALWTLAILIPLILFSLPAGKLATYLTPLAPPAALLAAGVIQRWLDGTFDASTRSPDNCLKPPDVRITLLLAITLATVGGGVAMFIMLGPGYAALMLPLIGPIILAARQWRAWSRGPAARRPASVGLWVGGVVAWLWLLSVATLIAQPYGARQLATFAAAFARQKPARLLTYDHTHYALSFYRRRHVDRVDTVEALTDAAAQHGPALVVVAEADQWRALEKQSPRIDEQWRTLATFSRWPRPGHWAIAAPDIPPPDNASRRPSQ